MRARAIIRILALAILVHYATPAFSQSPQGFSYQAIIRNSDGSALSNQNVLIRLSLTDETGDTTYYTEVHTLSTSPLGIANLIVGKGSTSDNFSTIPWSNGNIWLKVEVDKTQTSGYTLMGSTQLYSVPYAFYSLNGTPGAVGPKGDKGDTGDTGNGISSISANGDGTLTFNFTNGTTYTTFDLTGPQGVQGIQGETGPQGIQGIKGDKGDQGAPGTGLNNKGNWISGTTYGPGDYVFAENTSQTANSMWIVKAAAPFSSTTQPRLDSGNWVEFEAPAGPQGPQGPVGPLVSGTAGQTLRHDGTSWVANSFLYNNGTQIGIGTTTPSSYKLYVNGGDMLVNRGDGLGGNIKMAGHSWLGSADWGNLTLAAGSNSGNATIGLVTENTTKMTITGNGNVGIGVWPSVKLDVYQIGGASGTNTALGLRAGNTGTYYGNNQIVLGYDQTLNYAHSIKTRHNSGAGTMNAIDFYTWKYGDPASTIGGQHTMTLENGNVGIGTTSPGTKLDVAGNFRTSGELISTYPNQARFIYGNYGLIHRNDGSTYYMLLTNSGDQYGSWNGLRPFYIENSTGNVGLGAAALYIQHGGNVGIGTTTPAFKLDVSGRARFRTGGGSAGIWFMNAANTADRSFFGMYDDNLAGIYGITSGWGFLMNINNGYIGVGTATPTAKMVIQGSTTTPVTEPLFQVKDKSGNPVFTVYQDSVRIVVYDGAKGSKGVFAVSGRNTTKALTNNFLKITPDMARIWTGDPNQGFAAENIAGTLKQQYTKLTPKNSLIGHLAGLAITTGIDNTFMGTESGTRVTTGYENVFIGKTTGVFTTTGYKNTFIGESAGYYNISGFSNTFIGRSAGHACTTGFYNVFLGERAGDGQNGRDNTFVGYWCGRGTSGSVGNYNTAMGSMAGYTTYGAKNAFFGDFAGRNNTSASYNTFIGSESGLANTTGANNTALGYSAFSSGAAYTNSTALGYDANITASNQIRIGNTAVTSIGGQVGWSTLSDKRFKKEVKNSVLGLDFILKLRPITYYIDFDELANFLNTPDSMRLFNAEFEKSNMLQSGFAAQDVEEAAKSLGYEFSGIDKPKNDKDYYSLRYGEFTVPLVKAVQQLSAELENQKKQSEELKKNNNELLLRIEKLEQMLLKLTNNNTTNEIGVK